LSRRGGGSKPIDFNPPLFLVAARKGRMMKISARNVLAGKIVDIKKGATTSHVQIEVKGLIITSAITNEAVEELGLKVGGEASAVIKSSDVMVMVA
jgi:molybdopterin-binding protein